MLRIFCNMFCVLSFCVGLIIAAAPISAEENQSVSFHEPVVAKLVSEEMSIQPGRPFWVALDFEIEDHWHTYWKNPGDAGMPAVIEWQLPAGFTAEAPLWPTPKRFEVDALVGFGYEKNMTLLVKVTPPPSIEDSMVMLSADPRWVVCSDTTCLPGDANLSLSLRVINETPEKSKDNADLFAKSREQFPQTHQSLTAESKDGLIEIAMGNTHKNQDQIHKADFFPEDPQAVDYKIAALLESNTDQHKVILKANKESSNLKGVLVLYTSSGNQSYDVDIPILSNFKETPAITMINMKEGTVIAPSLEKIEPAHRSSLEFEGGVGLAIIFAFLGGLLLNLMPCVLPVISFKIMGFIKLAGQNRRLILMHGLLFSFGVLLSFWCLAGVLLILQTYGKAVGWGFQLQEPLFVAVLAAFLFVFALSLFGIFEMGNSVMSAAGQVEQKGSNRSALFGSFMSGVLATAVATPCTGPFLGTAIGYAVTLPPISAMAIFTSLGLGMSSPYLLLSGFPSLLRFIPKPGNWMIVFKESMGFLMLASTVWLIWVFSAQTDSLGVALFVGSLFVLSLASWIYGRWASPISGKLQRMVVKVIVLVLFVFGGYGMYIASSMESSDTVIAQNGSHTVSRGGWETFSPERVAELRKQGIPVFIDFTAKWCLICQANHLVLSTDEIDEQFKSSGVVKMKADWTKRDPVIAAELKKLGRNSVPLYVLYNDNVNDDISKSVAEILPQVLTQEIVLNTLKKIEPKTRRAPVDNYAD